MVNPPSSSSSSSSPPPPPFASPTPVGAAVLVNVGGCVPSSAPANAAACDAAAIAADSASTLRRGCPPSWVLRGEQRKTEHRARECTRLTVANLNERNVHAPGRTTRRRRLVAPALQQLRWRSRRTQSVVSVLQPYSTCPSARTHVPLCAASAMLGTALTAGLGAAGGANVGGRGRSA